MKFENEITVRFNHTDPAGIVFYPRFFEMLNEVVEDWFDRGLGTDFRTLHLDQGMGTPAVRVETDFVGACRLGDRLTFELEVAALGRSSIDLSITAHCGADPRLRSRVVLAYSRKNPIRSSEIPAALRQRMLAYSTKPQPPKEPILTPVEPPSWGRPNGYANGMLGPGGMLFIAGQIGWDSQKVFSDDFVQQVRQTLLNILTVLEAAGAGPEHVARLTWYVVDRKTYKSRLAEIGTVYRETFGRHFPAMSVIEVSGLVEDAALVEIEATAIVG